LHKGGVLVQVSLRVVKHTARQEEIQFDPASQETSQRCRDDLQEEQGTTRKMKSRKLHAFAAKNLRFDAYCGTTTSATPEEVLTCFPLHSEALTVRTEHATSFSYSFAMYVETASGKRVGTILYGGTAREVFFEVKGDIAHVVASFIRLRFNHQVSRADVCIDTRMPGAFRALVAYCVSVKKLNARLRSERRGDWDDHPEDGRTYYLGSASSLCQICVYEKGKSRAFRGMDLEDWVRMEWRIRPETKAQKVLASKLEPHELVALSPMGRRVAELVLRDFDPTIKIDVPRVKSTCERAFESMITQYSKTMLKMAGKLGSVDQVLAEIGFKLTGKPWVAVPLLADDAEDPHYSDKGGQDFVDFDPIAWLESTPDGQHEQDEKNL
jgi:hypothetical protein